MKVLYVTTIGGTMGFFKTFIREMLDQGHTVDIATNETIKPIPPCYREWDCRVFTLSCSRSPFAKGNLTAIKQIRRLVEENRYDIVHCHTPIAAACTRLACRKLRKKQGVKVFYTTHGFHFYKGAPLKNWMIFYPVEKLCARYTDKLITINSEDFALAQKKMKAKEVVYVPGVGVDLTRFQNLTVDKAAKRRELGIPEDATLLLSVGEVNQNKNHQVIVRAMAQLRRDDLHYMIAGVGPMSDELRRLAEELGISDRLHLLGYRKDVPELCYAADIFCFPSCREGLGLAAIEGMACGLPLITSDKHGINDYSVDGETGYKCEPTDAEGFAKAIEQLANDPSLRESMGKGNITRAQKYDVDRINQLMKDVYAL